jgi:ribonuclease P protein component
MLPGQYRLRRSKLFQKTLSSGKALCHTPYFTMVGLPRLYESVVPIRFGLIVSKKVSNRAVQRNRVKRRLRSLIRENLLLADSEALKPYIALVLIARKEILGASYSEIQKLLLNAMDKIR